MGFVWCLNFRNWMVGRLLWRKCQPYWPTSVELSTAAVPECCLLVAVRFIEMELRHCATIPLSSSSSDSSWLLSYEELSKPRRKLD